MNKRYFNMRLPAGSWGVNLAKFPRYKYFIKFCKNHPNIISVIEDYVKINCLSKEGTLEEWFDEEFYIKFVREYSFDAEHSFDQFAYIMSRFIELEHNIILETKTCGIGIRHCLMCLPGIREEETENIIQSYLNELYHIADMPVFMNYVFFEGSKYNGNDFPAEAYKNFGDILAQGLT